MKMNDTTETKYYTYDFKDNYVMIEKRSFSQTKTNSLHVLVWVTEWPVQSVEVDFKWFFPVVLD